MTRKAVLTFTTLCILLAAVALVYAGVHFGGSTTFGFGSLKATVNVFGVGQSDNVTVTMTATGNNLTAWCQNHGGNRVPGHQFNVNMSTSQTVVADSNGNATASFEVSLLPPLSQAGCPNTKTWTVTDLEGPLHVTFTAVDSARGFTDSESFICTVDEQHRSVVCQ